MSENIGSRFPMRILGVDYGSARVGLAISDEDGVLAIPLKTVENSKAVEQICQIISEKGVQQVVVGMPRNMNGSYGPQAKEVQCFVKILQKKLSSEICLWDERLTTQGIERMLIQADVSRERRKQVVDKLAAQQILQSYLDSQSADR